MQTIQVLKKVTKLEIDRELLKAADKEREAKQKAEDNDDYTTEPQDEEVEALQADVTIKNKLQ